MCYSSQIQIFSPTKHPLILFLDGGGVSERRRADLARPDLSTDFYGLAVHVPFGTTGTGARVRRAPWQPGRNLGFQGTGGGNFRLDSRVQEKSKVETKA